MLLVKLEHFPKNRDEHKNLWNHHLDQTSSCRIRTSSRSQHQRPAATPRHCTWDIYGQRPQMCNNVEAERHALYLHITCIFMIFSGCLYETVLYWHISRYHLLYACLWKYKTTRHQTKHYITLHAFRYVKSLRSVTWNYSLSTFHSVAWHQVTLHFIHTYMIFL